MAKHEVLIHENTSATKESAPYLGSYLSKETMLLKKLLAVKFGPRAENVEDEDPAVLIEECENLDGFPVQGSEIQGITYRQKHAGGEWSDWAAADVNWYGGDTCYLDGLTLAAGDDLEVKGTVDTAKPDYEQGVAEKSYHV